MANLTSKDWRDLIFQGKNKEFGAYQMRKNSEKRHTLAVIFMFIGLVIVVIGVIAFNKYTTWKAEQDLLAQNEQMAMAQIGPEEEVPEEEEEEQKIEIPEPEKEVVQQEEAQTQQTQIAIVPPDQVKNEVHDITELLESDAKRGQADKEGEIGDLDTKVQAPEVIVAPQVVEPVVKEPEPPKEDNKVFDVVEQAPQFLGGNLNKWLSNNIRYPEAAQQNGVSGRVIVQFVVERDGSITDVKVVKGVDKDLDAEAVRVVKKMPKWQPGKNNGHPVRTKFTLPINFTIQNM